MITYLKRYLKKMKKYEASLLLKNVKMTDGSVRDITVAGGVCVENKPAGTISDGDAETVTDCSEYICIPAAVDMHVHMRAGASQSHKETWETGTKAAVAGGVGTVVDQPNTIPAITDAETLGKRIEEAAGSAYCNFAVNGGVTPESKFKEMYAAGALAFGETFYAESSYGTPVTTEFLKTAFAEIKALGATVTVHAEEIAAGEDTDLSAHDLLRSAEGERRAVENILAVAPADLRLHLCHLSAPQSVNAVIAAAKLRRNAEAMCGATPAGAGRVCIPTFEVMPHHLLLSREMFPPADAFAKVNPPLRDENTRKALFAMWDLIDVIASDSAPHTIAEKRENSFKDAPSGIPGVETMMPLMMRLVADKRITLDSLIEKTVRKPAAILNIRPSGFAVGELADFALYPKDLEKASVKISADNLHSKAGWTPYEGMSAVFPEIVVVNGEIAYDSGDFFKVNPRRVLGGGVPPA